MFQLLDDVIFSECRLVYQHEDYSFDTEPKPDVDAVTSLLLNDLQLEIDDTGRVLYIWGLCPHPSWKPTSVSAPEGIQLALRYMGNTITAGVSVRINPGSRWDTWVNRNDGSLCIGAPTASGVAVNFAPGAVAILDKDELVAIWLKPVNSADLKR